MPVPNIFAKVGNLVLGQSVSSQGAEQQIREARTSQSRRAGREGIHSLLLEFRAHLLNAVSNDLDVQPIVQGFVQLDVPLKEKFISLHVTELLKQNNQSVDGLKHIHSGLRTIIKYAKYLIKDNRQEQWGTISFKNAIVQRKILPLNGSSQVLSQLGYTEVTDFGQSFPPGKYPDKSSVIKLIADMELFLAELKIYCSGRHLHPESIGQYLPQDLRDELEERQASEMSMMESCDTMSGSASSQEAQTYPTNAQIEEPRKAMPATVSECNNNKGAELYIPASVPSKGSVIPNLEEISSDVYDGRSNKSSSQHASEVKSREEVSEQSNNQQIIGTDENQAIPDLVQTSITGSDAPGTATSENPSDLSASSKLTCSVCGDEAVFLCRQCYDNQMALCENCNKRWHKRMDRQHHNPQPIPRHHRLSLDSFGSATNVHFDENYGIMAASKQRRDKQDETPLMNASKFDHTAQPEVDNSTLLDKGLGLPPDKQSVDLERQHQVQQGAVNQSQYQFLMQSPPPHIQQSPLQDHQQHMLQQQQLYQGYDQLQQQQQQQIPTIYRMQGQHSLYNPSVMPSFATPATPAHSQSQNMNMILSSATSSNSEFTTVPHQFHGQTTMAGQMYPTSHMAGMYNTGNQAAYSLSNMPADSRVGMQHQQQQRPNLPPYIQAQLDQGTHLQQNTPLHYQGPRWTHPVSSASPYQQFSYPNHPQQYRPREQQIGQRHAYPYNKNTMDMPSAMYGMSPGQVNIGGLQFQQTPLYSLQQYRDPSQPNQTALQSMPPNNQGLQSAVNHMDPTGGTFAGLNIPNTDRKLGHKQGSLSYQREMGLGGQHGLPNTQEHFQHPVPLRYPYPGSMDSPASSCQSPFISAPSSPLSTPPPSSPSLPSEYIKKLSMEPDLTKRINMCDHFIRNINADMRALEDETEKRMEGPGSFYSTSECREMQRRKEEMVKEKRKLESFKEKQQYQVNHFYKGIESSSIEQEIYYPPDISPGRPSAQIPTNSMNIAVQDTPKTLNVMIDNNKPLPAHLPHSVAPTSNPTNTQDTHLYGSRVPVEDSITETCEGISDLKDLETEKPPALPPRSKKLVPDKNVLAMTIPAPKIPRSPSPSDRMWECQHCTFLNPINVHICQVCHRTSDNPNLVTAPREDQEGDSNSDDDIEESAKQGVEDDEEEEKSILDDQEKDDFIATLVELQNEINPKKPPLFEEDDDDVADTQLWDIEDKIDDNGGYGDSTIGQHIIGSQKQIMEEKKRAKKEFELREQQQAQLFSNATTSEYSSPVNQSALVSSANPAPSSSSQTLFGVGARPKNTNRVPLKMAPSSTTHTSNQSNSNLDSNTREALSDKSQAQALPEHPSSTLRESRSDSIKNSLARMEELRSIEKLQANGAHLTQLIKMADLEDFDIQAVQIAIEISESMNANIEPMAWLRTNWKKNVAKIAAQACGVGQKGSPNNVGEVTLEEAEVAYIICQGNMKEATEKCVQDRQALYEKLSALAEDFPREEILEAMCSCKGDATEAQTRLMKAKLEPFVDRVWQQQNDSPATPGTVGTKPPLTVASFSTSVIGHQQFQDMMRDKTVDTERRVRMIYVEGRLHSWGRADMVIKILDQDAEIQEDLDEGRVTLEDIVEAVRDCQDRASALAYLRQECQICFGRFPMNKIYNLNTCQCRLCQECFVSHFEVAIREKHVRHWVCPQCSLPDLSDLDEASNYLQFLGMQLKPMIGQDLRDLFETKFRDWHLQKMDLFRWCAHCAEGFLAENLGGQLRMTCPRCGERTCFNCKKQWEDQHEGLTCEEFSQWKVDNDPTNQSVGLAKHLDENGIDCPACKMRFALAKGGCMHFKCPQCGHEFCSGCNEPYHHKNMCVRYKLCKNLGLHCHCPRDCFSFLRDYTVKQLQTLLEKHTVTFNVAAPADQLDRAHCPVVEQKEFDGEGNRDEKCGRDALQGGAGLCENHYKEYLVVLINSQSLDPVSLMSKDEMETLLTRYDLQTPPLRARDTPEVYKANLVKV
ncbi:hypothetical protein EGW08_002851, partial [Elysia chlorotica]